MRRLLKVRKSKISSAGILGPDELLGAVEALSHSLDETLRVHRHLHHHQFVARASKLVYLLQRKQAAHLSSDAS